MVTIRALQHDDIAEVLRINAAAVPAVFRLDASEVSRLLAISGLHLAAVRSDGCLTGYALAFSSAHPYDGEEFLAFRRFVDDPFLYVDQIAIEQDRRGTGIGRALYRELASCARGLGASSLCCEVNIEPPNPGSLMFHEHMGFARVGEFSASDGRKVALLSLPA